MYYVYGSPILGVEQQKKLFSKVEIVIKLKFAHCKIDASHIYFGQVLYFKYYPYRFFGGGGGGGGKALVKNWKCRVFLQENYLKEYQNCFKRIELNLYKVQALIQVSIFV